ncbi:uncharacterized protein [Mobula birostris]|uniref:uncharacterized protein n=1 Tax=Mobula birostris TaxID=1983395 RepID=UPI003B2819F8
MKFADVVLLCSGLGILDGASLPHKYSTVLLSALPREVMERDNVRQWEYITPTSKYDGSSEADQVKVNSSRKSPSVNEVQLRSYNGTMRRESSILIDVRINEIDHMMRLVRPVGSNVVLPGFKPKNLESIQWSFLNYKTKKAIIQYSHHKFMINPFYRHRAEFNVTSGALLLRDLRLKDSGIYEVILNPKGKTLTKGDEISSIHLDVQDQQPTPLIIQTPAFIIDRVQLNCFAKASKKSGTIWHKDNTEIVNDKHHRLEYDGSILFIDDVTISDCGLYSCTVMNEISKSSTTHFLSVDGNLFVHEDTLVGSVIVLVSAATSFCASAFIVYALEKDQVKTYWLHVTSAIVVFHGMSLFCQLITFVIFNVNAGFSPVYRAGSGIGCILCLATVTYVMVLFLHHHSQHSLSFLSNCWKRNIFLGSETIAVLIACLPLIKSKQNLKKCRLSYHALSVKIILMVMLYVCGLGLFALFHTKFSFKLRRNYVKLKEVKRYRQSRNEES